jgi:hypothetical protein
MIMTSIVPALKVLRVAFRADAEVERVDVDDNHRRLVSSQESGASE